MSKINQVPSSLQSLLGNVNQGVNPSDLSGVVSPGVDLVPFWGLEKTKFRVAASSIGHVIGQGVEMVVPAGEAWVPLAVSTNGFCLAEQDGVLMLHITDNAGVVRPILAVSDYVNATSSTLGIACQSNIQGRFVMGPGMRFRSEWLSATGLTTNATLSIDLMYYSLKI